MRIIAGQWRSRRLISPKGDLVRPTTDRVKEALFSIIGTHVRDALFLDVCCGAGGLGLEALSRGARQAVFVDKEPRSLKVAKQNLELCGASGETWTLVKANAVTWLQTWQPTDDDGPWWLLADPPYRSGVAEAIMSQLPRLFELPGFDGAVIEHAAKLTLTPDTSLPTEPDRRVYGESCLTILRPSAVD